MSVTIPEVTARESAPNSTWRCAVETATAGTFAPIGGLNSFARTPNTTTADGSDFNDGRYGRDVPVQKKVTVSLTVLRRNDGTAYDAGQEVLRQAADEDELVRVRYWDTAFPGAESYEADAYVQWTPTGGSGTALQAVNVVLNVQGPDREVAAPGTTAPVWAATTSYDLYDDVSLSTGQTLEATTAGTSGAAEPTAPAAVGGTVVDGSVTWTRRS